MEAIDGNYSHSDFVKDFIAFIKKREVARRKYFSDANLKGQFFFGDISDRYEVDKANFLQLEELFNKNLYEFKLIAARYQLALQVMIMQLEDREVPEGDSSTRKKAIQLEDSSERLAELISEIEFQIIKNI